MSPSALARLGTAADNAEFRDRLHDDQLAFNGLVKDTLSSVTEAKPELEPTQFTRLSLQFDAAYKKYQKLQTALDRKQKSLLAEHLADDHTSPTHSNGRGRGEGYGSTQGRVQQQVQEEEEVVFTEWHHEEVVRRVEEIKAIEGEVAEVAELYKDLHLMVHDQQTGIDAVSENISTVKAKTEDAQVQLEGAQEHQKKGRTRKCCVAVIVIACIAVAVVVLLILKK